MRCATRVFQFICNTPGCGFIGDTISKIKTHYKTQHDHKFHLSVRRHENAVLKWILPLLRTEKVSIRPTLEYTCLFSNEHSFEDAHTITPLLILEAHDTMRIVVQSIHGQPSSTAISETLLRVTEVTSSMYTQRDHKDVLWILLNTAHFSVDGKPVPMSMRERAIRLHTMLQTLKNTTKVCGDWGLAIALLFFDTEDDRPSLVSSPFVSSDMAITIKYWL